MFSICMFLPRLGRDRYLPSCCLLNSALSRGIADGEVSAMAWVLAFRGELPVLRNRALSVWTLWPPLVSRHFGGK